MTETAAETERMVARWRERVAQRERELVGLERDERFFRRLYGPGLFAPLVGFFWSPLVAFLSFVVWVAFIGVSSWIIGVRRVETQKGLREAERAIAALEAEPPANGPHES